MSENGFTQQYITLRGLCLSLMTFDSFSMHAQVAVTIWIEQVNILLARQTKQMKRSFLGEARQKKGKEEIQVRGNSMMLLAPPRRLRYLNQ